MIHIAVHVMCSSVCHIDCVYVWFMKLLLPFILFVRIFHRANKRKQNKFMEEIEPKNEYIYI